MANQLEERPDDDNPNRFFCFGVCLVWFKDQQREKNTTAAPASDAIRAIFLPLLILMSISLCCYIIYFLVSWRFRDSKQVLGETAQAEMDWMRQVGDMVGDSGMRMNAEDRFGCLDEAPPYPGEAPLGSDVVWPHPREGVPRPTWMPGDRTWDMGAGTDVMAQARWRRGH